MCNDDRCLTIGSITSPVPRAHCTPAVSELVEETSPDAGELFRASVFEPSMPDALLLMTLDAAPPHRAMLLTAPIAAIVDVSFPGLVEPCMPSAKPGPVPRH